MDGLPFGCPLWQWFLGTAAIACTIIIAVFSARNEHRQVMARIAQEKHDRERCTMQPQDMTMAELKAYNGTGPESAPILVAISGRIFNVWRSRWRYIEGGEYAQFAGHECGRALSKMSFDEAEIDGPVTDLPAYEEAILEDWIEQFEQKHDFVGRLTDWDRRTGGK